jgi:hypothetical protein
MIPVRARPGRPVVVPPSASTATAFVVTPSPVPARCQINLPLRGFPPPGLAFAILGPPVLLGLGPFGAILGQFVTSKPDGRYQTIDIQRGTVTAVGSSSITVKSSDGFTTTYRVTSSTNVDGRRAGSGSVKTGQTVSVLATVNGASATAAQIVDVPALPLPSRMLPIKACPSPSTGR